LKRPKTITFKTRRALLTSWLNKIKKRETKNASHTAQPRHLFYERYVQRMSHKTVEKDN
jgi:hypothetical protein